MAISSYEVDGQIFWKVYLNFRSKIDSTIRRQKKTLWLSSEKEAQSLEKRLIRELTAEIALLEGKGFSWEQVVNTWEHEVRTNRSLYNHTEATINDYVNAMRKWTAAWLKRPAAEITRTDAKEVIKNLELEGRGRWSQEKLKSAINTIYKWGIEEGYIKGVFASPVQGLKATIVRSEKVPDILTIGEIRRLLAEAQRMEHRWYPIWAMALLTGMRNGELHALLWEDIDLENKKISVNKSYQAKGRYVKSTKSGEWRTVPISDQLAGLLIELKKSQGTSKHVLPRFARWDKGEQAQILRQFCKGIGIKSIRFHALRACFATQLLAHDIAPARVMKVCGWKDLKTMQHYIRVAGIEEDGATQVLKVLPDDKALTEEIASLLEEEKTNKD